MFVAIGAGIAVAAAIRLGHGGVPPRPAAGASSAAMICADGPGPALRCRRDRQARIARQLRSSKAVTRSRSAIPASNGVSALSTIWRRSRRAAAGSDDPAVVIAATPPGTQLEVARRAMREGIAVVTTSNQTSEVRRLLELDDEAVAACPVVVGAGFMPGLSCVLARHGQ